MDPGNPHVKNGRAEQHRVVSPARSCESMKSDWSMGHPHNFKDVPYPHSSWIQKESSDCPFPSCVSMKSDKSMDPPMSFKRQIRSPELSPACPTLPQAAPGDVACDVCSSLTRPAIKTCVTCSVSYCENHLRDHYNVPELQKHTLVPLNEEVKEAAPGDCDVCSSLTRRAIKTCVTCSASYCENHVERHYTVPALQKHTLVQVNEDTRLWNSGRMEEIKEEPTVDSECGEHQEIAGKRRKKRMKKMHGLCRL